jgi:cell division protein FtsN
MAIDYKTRERGPKPRRRSNKSCGFWFVFGLVLGGFGVGLYLMVQKPIQAPAPAQAKKESPDPPPTPTRFDFHEILPELEVIVSDDELAKPDTKKPDARVQETPKPDDKPADTTKKPEVAKAEPTKTNSDSAKAQGGDTYMIQVASLRTAADAERLKAQLAIQGIQTRVQSVTVNGKDTYHRVQAGPYHGKQSVNEVRSQLKSKGMDTFAIKLK